MVSEEDAKIIRYCIYAIIGIVILILLLGCFYTVGAGERAVIVTMGKPTMTSMSPGFHLKIPIIQHAVKMDVQTQKYVVEKASAASRDLQTVTTDITVNYYINPESVPVIYQNLGSNYQDTIINPAVLETVKQVTAQYTAEELITMRPEVKEKIDVALTTRLKTFNVNVQAVSITNFDFSAVFNQAIENKVTTEQNALAAKNKLEQVQYEAKQTLAQAEGQGKAMLLIGNDRYVQLQAIQKWDGHLPLATGGAIPFIQLNFSSTQQ